jgi:hypothetical protein
MCLGMSKVQTIERLLEGAAAAWMAGCVGAAVMLVAPAFGIHHPFPFAAACGAAAGLIACRGLAAFRGPQHELPQFHLLPIETIEPDLMEEPISELLLTHAMVVHTTELLLTLGQMLINSADETLEPLLLDDVLAELRPNSRVVQLFDPARMPTPGELKSRIDRHISEAGRGAPGSPQPDASQALYDALADLRRSLA